MNLLAVFITLVVAVAQVQQPSFLDNLRQKAASESIQVDYEYSVAFSGFKTSGEGSVDIQGTSYHMQGNGLQIYCDGASTWLIDEVAEEVIIESADSKDAGLLANPILLLMNIEESAISYKVQGESIILNMPDGSVIDIRIKSIKTVEIKKPEAFRPPTEFPKRWIVTDLR